MTHIQFDYSKALSFFGEGSALSRIIYGIVGICGLINLGLLFKPDVEVERSTEARTTR